MNGCDKTRPSTMSTVTMPPLVKRTKSTKSSSVGTKRRRSTKADSVDSGNDEESPRKKLRKRKSTKAKEVDLMALMADDDDDNDDGDVEEEKEDDDGYISYEELQEVWEAVEPATKSARRKILALEDLLRKNLALAKNQPRFRAVSRVLRSDFQKELKEAAKAINGTCEMLQEVAAVKARIWKERRPPTPVPVEIPENVAYYSDISDDDFEEGCLVIDEGEDDAEVEPEVEQACLTTSEPETTEEQRVNKAKQIYKDLFGTDFENDEDSSTSNDTNDNTRAYSPISEASSRPPSSDPCQPSIFDTSFDNNEQSDVTNTEVFLHIPENPEDSPDEEEEDVATSFPICIVSVDSVVEESEEKSKEATVEVEIPLKAAEGRNLSVEQPRAAVPVVKDECDGPTASKVPKLEDPKSPEVENGLSAPVGALNESELPTGAIEAVKDESSVGIAAENPKVEAPGSSDVEKAEPAVTDEEKPTVAEPITVDEEVSIIADRRPHVKDFTSLSRQLWFIRVLMAKDKTAGCQQLGTIVHDVLAQTSWKLPLVQGFALMMNFLSDPVAGGGLDERSIQIASYLATVVAAKLNHTNITSDSWQEVVKAFRGSSLVAYTGFLHIAAAGAFFKALLGVKSSVAAVSAEMDRMVPSSKNANDMSAWKVLCEALNADARSLPSDRIRGVLGMNAKKYRTQIFGDIRQRGGDLLKHEFVFLPDVDSDVDILVHPEYRKVFKWCAGYPLSWNQNRSAGHPASVSALRAIRPRRNSENVQDIRIVPLKKLLAPENEENTFSMPQLEEELMQQPTNQSPVVQPLALHQPVPIVNIHRSGSSNARIIAVTVDMPLVAQLVQQQDPPAPAMGGPMAQPMMSSTPQASGQHHGVDVRGQVFEIMKGHSKRSLSQQAVQQVGQQSGDSVEQHSTTGSQQAMVGRRSESVENLQQLAGQNGPTVTRKRSNPFEPASQPAESSAPRQPLSTIQNAVGGRQQTMTAAKDPVPAQASLQKLLSSDSQPLLTSPGMPTSGQQISAWEVTMPPPNSNQLLLASSGPGMSAGVQQKSAWSGTMPPPDYPINPGQAPANGPVRTVSAASDQLEQNLLRQQVQRDIVLEATVASQQSALPKQEAANRARMQQAMAGLPPLKQRSVPSPGKQPVHQRQYGVSLRPSVAVPPPARPLHQLGQSGQQVQQQSPILLQSQQDGHLQAVENLRQQLNQQPQVVKNLLANLLQQQQAEQVQHSREQQQQVEQVQVAQQEQQLAIQQQYDGQLEAARAQKAEVLRAKQHLDAQQQRQQEIERAVQLKEWQQFRQSQQSKQAQQDRMGSQMQQQQLYPPQIQGLQQLTDRLGSQTPLHQQPQHSQFQNAQVRQQAMAPQLQQQLHPSQFQNSQLHQQAMAPQTQQQPHPSKLQNVHQQQQQHPSQFQNLHQQPMASQTHQSRFQNAQQQQGMALQNGLQQVNPQQLQNLHQQQQMQQQQHPAQLQNPHQQQQMSSHSGQQASLQLQQQQVSPSQLQNARFQQQPMLSAAQFQQQQQMPAAAQFQQMSTAAQFQQQQQMPTAAQFQQLQQMPTAAQFQQQQQMPTALQFQQQQLHRHLQHSPQQVQQSGASVGQMSSNLGGQVQHGQQQSHSLQNQGFFNPTQCCSGPPAVQGTSRSHAVEEHERLWKWKEEKAREKLKSAINVSQRLVTVQPMQNQAPNPMMTQSQQQPPPPCYPNQAVGTYQQSFTQNCCQMQHEGHGRQMPCQHGGQFASSPMQPTNQGNVQFPATQPVAPSDGGSRSQNVGHQGMAVAQPLMSPSVGQNHANMPLHPPNSHFGCHPQQQAQGLCGAANHEVAAVVPRVLAQQRPSGGSVPQPRVSPQCSNGWIGSMAGPSVSPAQNQPGNRSSLQNYVGQVRPSLPVQPSPPISASANQMRVPQFFKPPTGHQASTDLPQLDQSHAGSEARAIPPPSFNQVSVNQQVIDQNVAKVLHPQTGQVRDANRQLGPSAEMVAPAPVPLGNFVGTQEQRILPVHRPSTPQLVCSSPEESMPPRPLSAPPTPAAPPQQDEPAGYKEGYEETVAPVPSTATPAPATNPHPRERKIGKVTITCRRPKAATGGDGSKAAEQPRGTEENTAGDAEQRQEKAAEEFQFAVPHPVSQPSQGTEPTANTNACVDQDCLNPEETCDQEGDPAEILSEVGHPRPCDACGAPSVFLCYCEEATYCGEECQLKHWNDGHQELCEGGPASVRPAQPEAHV